MVFDQRKNKLLTHQSKAAFIALKQLSKKHKKSSQIGYLLE